MLYVLGETVVIPWTVLDLDSNPLSGVTTPAGITFSLFRVGAGGVLVASSETVTFPELGATGHYAITFTPGSVATYAVQLREIHASSLQRVETFRDIQVAAAGAVFAPNFANAYCSQSDVERWAGMTFGAATTPTSTQVAGFAETRASEITGILAGVGFTVTPATVVAGSIEEDLLREANAIGAAGDAILSKFAQETPSRSFKGPTLYEEYQKRVDRLVSYIKTVKSPQSLRTHISSGEVTLPTTTPIEDAGFRTSVTMTEEF